MKIATLLFCLFTSLLGVVSAEDKPWGFYRDQERDFLREAMRQSKDQMTLVEYRWLAKPTGLFAKEINEEYAPLSLARRDAKNNNAELDASDLEKFKNRDWWLVLRVIIAVDRNDPLHATLTGPPALADLTTPMRALFDAFPTQELRDHKRWPLVAEDLRVVPAAIYRATRIHLQYDQFAGSINQGFPFFFFPTVGAWYTRQGAPYTKSPHVVQSVWFWHDYVENAQVEAYIKDTEKKFSKENASYPSPIKILDVRTVLVPVK